MEYIGFVFGIFGLLAYLQISELKNRVAELERQLTATKGTSFHYDRQSLIKVIKAYMGQSVIIDLKEDQMDVDITMYGNTNHGSNTIVDVDEEWVLVHIESAKGNMDKLLRLESIRKIERRVEK